MTAVRQKQRNHLSITFQALLQQAENRRGDFGTITNPSFFLLRRKNFSADQKTFELAQDCAANAGGDLVHAYFPYDIDFDAWAITIVQNHCKKAIDRLLRAGRIPDHQLVSLTDLPAELARTADLGGGQLTHWRLTLLHLIEQLPTEERETVLLHNFVGMTFLEIGQYLGVSTTTAYRRYFSAIDMLRENLVQNHIQPN